MHNNRFTSLVHMDFPPKSTLLSFLCGVLSSSTAYQLTFRLLKEKLKYCGLKKPGRTSSHRGYNLSHFLVGNFVGSVYDEPRNLYLYFFFLCLILITFEISWIQLKRLRSRKANLFWQFANKIWNCPQVMPTETFLPSALLFKASVPLVLKLETDCIWNWTFA